MVEKEAAVHVKKVAALWMDEDSFLEWKWKNVF